jgi:DNA-binding SARP family transcriptional activator/Tfp pilus assembly protein PilF
VVVRFRVLGPLEIVSGDGRAVELRGRLPRAVLAALLLHANRPVGIEALVEQLWEGGPPPSAAANLRTYVSRLRRALGADEPANRIQAGPDGGYVLRVELGELDSAEFERLAASGREASGRGDWPSAAERLTAALGLWRGAVLAGLPPSEPWRTEAARLEQLRLAVLEDSIDARLALGHHAELVAELRALTDQHRLRERLWAQWMLALYRSGRQADALAVYRRLRDLLAEELGVFPGPQLQRLHQRILTGDPDLDGPRTERRVPAQLPAGPAAFTGRGTELDRLLARGAGGAPATVVISAVNGMAGVGKTALAVHAAHRMAEHYPDGQLFLDLHGYTQGVAPTDPAAALDAMLRALGTPGPQIPRTLDERAALYRTCLAGKRVLIVLDNAGSEDQVLPLLPGTPGCLVLITSRRRLSGLDGVDPVGLDVLPLPEAVALFTATAGADRVEPGRRRVVEEIVEACGRLPLAVRIAAARLRHRPATTLAELAVLLQDVTELRAGQRSIIATFDLSYANLTVDQQRALRLLGLHPGTDVDLYAAAALTGTSTRQARRTLDGLIEAHLLDQHAPGRYRFHDLLRAHAAHTAAAVDSASDRRAALDRLFDHYAHATAVAMDLAYPDHTGPRPAATPSVPMADQRQALAWLDTELPNLLAAATHAASNGRGDHTTHQSTTLHRHLRTRGHYTRAAALHRQALHAARATGDPAAELDALNNLGWTDLINGRPEQSTESFERALRIARATGLRTSELDAFIGLGNNHYLCGRYPQATDAYQRALHLARTTGGHAGELAALIGLGRVHQLQDRVEQATGCYEEALGLARSSGDHHGELTALTGLGYIHHQHDRHDRATDCYRRAVDLARATGDRNGELYALIGLGNVDLHQRRPAEATAAYQHALGIAQATGNRNGELNALTRLGHIHRLHGRHQRAIDAFTQAARIAQIIGDRNGQFEAHDGLGRTHHALGRHQQALASHQAALDLAAELDQPADEARAHDGLARTHHALGHHHRARHHWQAALQILTNRHIDHTYDPDVSTTTIRAHLTGLDGAPGP